MHLMIAAIIENGVVVNVIVVESLDGLIDGEGADVGDLYINGEFVPPPPQPPVVPSSVTRRQFKLGLLSLDLLDDVEAAATASSDRALKINWAEALDFERNNPFVAQMASALGKTDDEIDALFILAKTL